MDDHTDPPIGKSPDSRVDSTRRDAHSGSPGTAKRETGNTLVPAPLPTPALDRSNIPMRRGNAFAEFRARGLDASGQPLKVPDPASAAAESKPRISPVGSYLNYDEELAVPMPRPRARRFPIDGEDSRPQSQPQSRPCLLKKLSTPDTTSGTLQPQSTSSMDGKKKSRLEALKSKLSFRDLSKEANKNDDPAPPVPRMPCLDSQGSPQRSASGKDVTGFTPSIYDWNRPKARRVQTTPSPASSSVLTQHYATPSKVPLAASGTYPFAHKSMAPAISPLDRPVGSTGQVKPVAERAASQAQLETATKRPLPLNIGQQSSSVSSARTIPAASTNSKKSHLGSTPPLPKYPVTDDSPPTLTDLTEGTGKVKYLPREWLMSPEPTTPSPTAEPPRHRLPSYQEVVPGPDSSFDSIATSGLDERMAEISTSLDSPSSTGTGAPGAAVPSKREILSLIFGIQRNMDSSRLEMRQELDDLLRWIHKQFQNLIDDSSDLERTRSGLSSRQLDLSEKISRFKQNLDIQFNFLNQRMSGVEAKVQEVLEVEVTGLAVQMQENNQRLEDAIARWNIDSAKSALFVEKLDARIDEMEKEIAELLEKQADRAKQRSSPLPMHPYFAQSKPVSTDCSVKDPQPTCVPVLPRSVTAAPIRKREAFTPGDTGRAVKRSVSFKSKGDLERGANGLRERVASAEESKQRIVFDRPRRDATSAGSGPARLGTAALTDRKGKLPMVPGHSRAEHSDDTSSGSSTPPPPVPRTLGPLEENVKIAGATHPLDRSGIHQMILQHPDTNDPNNPWYDLAWTAAPRPRREETCDEGALMYAQALRDLAHPAPYDDDTDSASAAFDLVPPDEHPEASTSEAQLTHDQYLQARPAFSQSPQSPTSIHSTDARLGPIQSPVSRTGLRSAEDLTKPLLLLQSRGRE